MKRIYILPNLFTSANFFCGILSMTLAINQQYVFAAYAIFAGIFFDILDGIVARWNNASTSFGFEFDSLADIVTSGIAPMILIYRMELSGLGPHGRIGLGIAFLYSVCTALRLARFNTQPGNQKKKAFIGLPAPASAGFLASTVLISQTYPTMAPFIKMPLLMIVLSYLMISNITYSSVLKPAFFKKKPFFYLVLILIVIAGTILYIHEALVLFFTAYLLHGPIAAAYRRWIRQPSTALITSETIEQKQQN